MTSRFEIIPNTIELGLPGQSVQTIRSWVRLNQAFETEVTGALDQNEVWGLDLWPGGEHATRFIRSFGFPRRDELSTFARYHFALVTGRLQYLQRWVIHTLTKRRREAYRVLRRIRRLPIDLVKRIVNPGGVAYPGRAMLQTNPGILGGMLDGMV